MYIFAISKQIIMKLIELYKVALERLFKEFRLIEKLRINTDLQEIKHLLRDDNDKIEFQKTIDRMIKENKKEDTVTINNRKITISL